MPEVAKALVAGGDRSDRRFHAARLMVRRENGSLPAFRCVPRLSRFPADTEKL
jgi:hypothetical protein